MWGGRFLDNIMCFFHRNFSRQFSGNPSARDEICVYKFGPGVTQQKADAANSREVRILLVDSWVNWVDSLTSDSLTNHIFTLPNTRGPSVIVNTSPSNFFSTKLSASGEKRFQHWGKVVALTISVSLGRIARLGLVLFPPRRCSRHGWCVTSWKVIKTPVFYILHNFTVFQ